MIIIIGLVSKLVEKKKFVNETNSTKMAFII